MKSNVHASVAALCAAAGLWAPPAAWAWRFPLNDTGMTQCIDNHKWWSSDCAKSRQDAADGRDVHEADPDDGVAGFSFRKVCRSGEMAGEGTCSADPVMGSGPDDWGCVYDNISKLTWENKTTDGGLHDSTRRFTYQSWDASDDPSDAAWLVVATNAEGLCGATNWRLPEVYELQSILHYGMGIPDRSGPMVDAAFFPNSGSPWARNPSVGYAYARAWYVDFSLGASSTYERHNARSVRLVHRGLPKDSAEGAQASGRSNPHKHRFVPWADGTEIKDTMTGLIWRRCGEGKTWNNETQTCDGHFREFSWLEAIDHAKKNINRKWRIPNVKELASLVDHEKVSPAIDHRAFPHNTSATFMSSTPVMAAGEINVQVVEFGRGSVTHREAFEYDRWPLRMVRRERE